MLEDLTMKDPKITAFVDMAIRHALQTPYLMDQLLALSAAHASTKHNAEDAKVYQRAATGLQTRGLSSYNAAGSNMSEENCLPALLYSIFLAQHVLFDTFSIRADINTFMDSLAGSFKLCAGVRAVAGVHWPSIQRQSLDQLGFDTAEEWNGDETGGGNVPEVSRLHDLVEKAGFNAPSAHACTTAVNLLEKFIQPRDISETALYRRANNVLQWPVLLPHAFIDMILQRRPEALVILGYFAVLVHDAREYWAFGNAGEFMVNAISAHLGSYWDEWLAWPNRVVCYSVN